VPDRESDLPRRRVKKPDHARTAPGADQLHVALEVPFWTGCSPDGPGGFIEVQAIPPDSHLARSSTDFQSEPAEVTHE